MWGWCFSNPCCPTPSSSSSSSSTSEFTGSTTGDCVDRCQDDVAPLRYSVEVTGITSGTCSSAFCTGQNRTWTCTYTTSCTWQEAFNTGSSCFGNPNVTGRVQLVDDGGGSGRFTFTLAHPTTWGPVWEKTVSLPVNCLSSHTLTLTSGTPGVCNNAPSTVTINPT